MSDPLLPPAFADLEPWAFYDAFFPRAEEAIAYCDGFPLDDMPADAERLFQLLHSLLMVSYAVEVWEQPEVMWIVNCEQLSLEKASRERSKARSRNGSVSCKRR